MGIAKLPAGITADAQANFGYFGTVSNLNNYAEATTPVTTAGTAVALTAAQILAGMTILNAGASGGFTINLPSTASMIAALGPTIPMDGSYSEPIHILNNGVGQTGTVTAGDAGTTLTGTMTCATNTTRKFILQVTSPTTITIQNCGSWGL
jgi:hypothetical protein